MSNVIDSIKLSGTVYTLSAQTSGGGVPESTFTAYTATTDERISQDEEVTAAGLNALNDKITPTVELTQAQYDALVTAGTVSADTYYIITDAQAGDLTNYYTKSETNTLLAGKQATLVSGTNIKTINNESILGSGNIDIQGGGTIDLSLDSGSTNPVANSAITNAINTKQDISKLPTYIVASVSFGNNKVTVGKSNKATGGNSSTTNNVITINNQAIFNNSNLSNLSLVETSAITTSVTSASTDSQIPSAKAVYDAIQEGGGGSITVDTALDSGSTNPVENRVIYNKIDEVEQVTAAGLNSLNDNFGGLKLVKLTQAEYNALATKDSSTLYIVTDS